MPWIQTWDGIIAGEQINPPEYRHVADDPRDEWQPDPDASASEMTAASFQKTALEIGWEIADLEEAAERQAQHDKAVRLAMEENAKFARSCRRRPRRK